MLVFDRFFTVIFDFFLCSFSPERLTP